MTRRKLAVNVFSTVLVFAAILVTALILPSTSTFLRDFSNVIIAIAGTYLAYCFQKRQTFLASLRELWHASIQAKTELVEYTHNPMPDQIAFNRAYRSLSTAIDMMRGVYSNVGETETETGLYPFEPLHDMRKALDSLGFGRLTAAEQDGARNEIMQAWNAFRFHFLKEFSVPSPRYYVTTRSAKDPRR